MTEKNASGQYTVDMLTEARNKCFEQSEDSALPMAIRNEFSTRYGQLDQLIDELMTRQYHQKTPNADEVEDMVRTNTALAKEITALSGAQITADTAALSFAILDRMLQIGMPLVEV